MITLAGFVILSAGYSGLPSLTASAYHHSAAHSSKLPTGLSSALAQGGIYTQQAELTASDGAVTDAFGDTVALSSNGSIALIGAWDKTVNGNNHQGAVYVFTESDGTWKQQAELTAGDGAASDDFGGAVALSGDGKIALISASNKNVDNIIGKGAAYIFAVSGGTWTQQAELTASDGVLNDGFGQSVALSSDGRTALIGVPVKNGLQGVAYVFSASSDTWTQQAELVATKGAAYDLFGIAVALSSDGSIALIGAPVSDIGGGSGPGAAYVFAVNNGKWAQKAKLTATDGKIGDGLGQAVALSSDGLTALVGADGNTGGNPHGAAYIFTASGSKWTQQAKVTAGGADYFGVSVALSSDGNVALIGANNTTVGPNDTQGAAYTFTRSGTKWGQPEGLIAREGAANDYFGSAVALSSNGGVALIGVPGKAKNQGTAYIFVAAAPTPIPTSAVSSCFTTTPPRLTVGGKAHITPGSPNSLRDAPSHDGNLIGAIPGGAEIQVLAGPVCDNQFVWWQVSYKGQTGWTAESDGKTYFITPE